MTVYKITNLINGKVYVGKTIQPLQKRWRQHIGHFRSKPNSQPKLFRAFKKYGIENFKIEVIDFAENNLDLNKKEKDWIIKLDSYYSGYNGTLGGDGFSGMTDEIRTKISKSMKGVVRSIETRKRMGLSKTGINSPTSKKVLVSIYGIPFASFFSVVYAADFFKIKEGTAHQLARKGNLISRTGISLDYI